MPGMQSRNKEPGSSSNVSTTASTHQQRVQPNEANAAKEAPEGGAIEGEAVSLEARPRPHPGPPKTLKFLKT